MRMRHAAARTMLLVSGMHGKQSERGKVQERGREGHVVRERKRERTTCSDTASFQAVKAANALRYRELS